MSTTFESDDWDTIWKQFAIGMALNPGRKYRYKILLALIKGLPNYNTLRVLDFGCGTGDLLEYLSEKLPKTKFVGADVSNQALKIAKLKLPKLYFNKLDSVTGINNDYFSHKKFDVIICSEVLEHLSQPEEALKHILKLLNDSGSLQSVALITVPAGPRSKFDYMIGHKRHYTRKSLEATLRSSGFEVAKIYRAGFPGILILRIATLIRGKRVINDVNLGQNQNFITMFALKIIDFSLSISAKDSFFGWQLIAVATKAP